MTTIFLGESPSHIKEWIRDHYSPTAPDGKVLYRTTAGGEWLQDDADIADGTFNGFANIGSAVEVIIPSKDSSGNSVTSIGNYAFIGCSSLASVAMPDSVTTISKQAFFNCRNLASVAIPDSVTTIGDFAFDCCSSLASVAIGNSVTSIGNYAFDSCSSLTSITMPNSVMVIGGQAFSSCIGLASVTFNSFTKNQVKSMTTNAYIFGETFHDDAWNPIEKSFTAICTDGSMTVHFSADDPATITFTDL